MQFRPADLREPFGGGIGGRSQPGHPALSRADLDPDEAARRLQAVPMLKGKNRFTEGGVAHHLELDLASGRSRVFASGLRNPNGMAIEPETKTLWTVSVAVSA